MVKEELTKQFPDADLRFVEVEKQFLDALGEETAPEKKRVIIGDQFLVVKQIQCKELGLDPDEWLLGQVSTATAPL